LLNWPSSLQLVIGCIIFGGVALVAIRSAILCESDRELFQRLFQGRETRFLRLLGVLNPHAGAPSTP
jgi:hypothetical protein